VSHSGWATNAQRQVGQVVSLPIIRPVGCFELDPFASAIVLAPSHSLGGLASITLEVGGTSGLRGKQ